MDQFELFLAYQEQIAKKTLSTIEEFRQKATKQVRTSNSNVVAQILKEAKSPLHITEIIKVANERYNISLERDSLSSVLNKKVKQGKLFIKTAPNTFSLIDSED